MNFVLIVCNCNHQSDKVSFCGHSKNKKTFTDLSFPLRVLRNMLCDLPGRAADALTNVGAVDMRTGCGMADATGS